MKSSSVLLAGTLVQYVSAFPGMGNTRREAGLLPLKPLVKAVTASVSVSASTSTSTSTNYPAWHPPQSGEGMICIMLYQPVYHSDLVTVRSPCPGLNRLVRFAVKCSLYLCCLRY
jgi:hypothetical protein